MGEEERTRTPSILSEHRLDGLIKLDMYRQKWSYSNAKAKSGMQEVVAPDEDWNVRCHCTAHGRPTRFDWSIVKLRVLHSSRFDNVAIRLENVSGWSCFKNSRQVTWVAKFVSPLFPSLPIYFYSCYYYCFCPVSRPTRSWDALTSTMVGCPKHDFSP